MIEHLDGLDSEDGNDVLAGLGGGPEGGLGRSLNHGYIGDDNILYRAIGEGSAMAPQSRPDA